MARAFEVQQPERILGKKLLLIDDVLTSGAADLAHKRVRRVHLSDRSTLVCVATKILVMVRTHELTKQYDQPMTDSSDLPIPLKT